MHPRRKTKQVRAGKLTIGGEAPVSVQSMTKTFTEDVSATLHQIRALEKAGCELVRVAVPHERACRAIPDIRRATSLPLIADIHFNPSLAIRCLEAGVDGVRVNPALIKDDGILREIAILAREKGAKIRVGVNSGSVTPREGLKATRSKDIVELMLRSALGCAEKLEAEGFGNIVLSLKASNPSTTIEANRKVAALCDYPLHIGVTAAGPLESSIVKSSILIGSLLLDGIGDTIRVSITGDPVREVEAGFRILEALGLRRRKPEVISCPTCGRTEIDVEGLVRRLEEKLSDYPAWLRVAVMGCVVNGPGEAVEADIGITGGSGFAFVFRKGSLIRKVKEEKLLEELLSEIDKFLEEKENERG